MEQKPVFNEYNKVQETTLLSVFWPHGSSHDATTYIKFFPRQGVIMHYAPTKISSFY
jgi:hypothetical protein